MPAVHHAIEIARPAADVFAFIAEFANDPRWRANVVEMQPLGEATAPGGAWSRQREIRTVPGGRRVATDAVITLFEPPSCLEVQRASGPVRPQARYELTALAADRTRLELTLEVGLAGVTWLFWPAVVVFLYALVRPSMPADLGRLRACLEPP
jgi:hypothetical protein